MHLRRQSARLSADICPKLRRAFLGSQLGYSRKVSLKQFKSRLSTETRRILKAKAKRHDLIEMVNAEKRKPTLNYDCYHVEAMICVIALIPQATVKNRIFMQAYLSSSLRKGLGRRMPLGRVASPISRPVQ